MHMFVIIQVNQVKFVLDFFSIGPEVFFCASKGFKFQVSPTNMTLSERLFMVWKREELGFPFGQ